MDLLLLGGTAFLGRAIATSARDRGIDVTCLARGTAPAVDRVRLVMADRDREDAYAEVADVRWDAVVDLTRQPGHARRAVRDLDAEHWVFVSSSNAYAAFDRLEQDESSPLLPPLGGDVMEDMEQYGPAKVACEEAIREGTASSTIIRSGLIGGAGDWSGRTGYYPWRFAHPTGEDVLVPPDPEFPAALIDVEDLAAWIVTCAQERIAGVFNATGPTTTIGAVLETARQVAGSGLPARPVPQQVLTEAGVQAWMGPTSLPLWIDDESWSYFATLDTTRAREHGLRTRPLGDTLAAALRSEEERTQPRQAGLTDEEERHLRSLLD